MTLKEKITKDVLDMPLINSPTKKEISDYEKGISNLEKIADEFAIEFAEWIDDLGYVKFPDLWICLEDESGKTSKELLEIYKKEKGL
jgi:hypothetical protein